MFAIHPDKVPGPDGFSASFFQSNWTTVDPAITKEIQNFFITGALPYSINSTHIRFIPKITSPKLVSEYRHIALCNVYYKVISKILALRLKPVLQDVISETQSAFVHGRAISDNVLITHEVLHYLKGSGAVKQCSVAVKTDISKAYDRLEWSFIRVVLERMGFCDTWIMWMMQCVSTVSYSFLLNNEVVGKVTPQRGIRQGDPLSPYIFILCGEILSGLCKKAQMNGLLPGIKVARNSPKINHMLFADDTMIFTKTDARSCSSLMDILHKYELASGQMINAHKSSISFSSKTPPEIRERVKTQQGIEKEGGVGKYLGLPEHFGRKKKDLFASIVDRKKQITVFWSTQLLSTAEKATMIQSVLSAIPIFAMTCFLLPLSLCKRIQSILTRFWWDSKDGERKICWISWEKLTQPKSLGGLGFRDIEAFNHALLAKIAWRLLTKPETLLARVLLGKYCHKTTFAKTPSSATISHGWRGILAGRDLLLQHLGKAIGNGESTSLWNDSWISPETNLKPIGPVFISDRDLVVADILTREIREWNKTRIGELLPELSSHILSLRPSILGANDSYIWPLQKSGNYTVKLGYFSTRVINTPVARLQSQPEETLNWKKYIWNPPLLPKIKFFLWKAVTNTLPTGLNLQTRGVLVNTNCLRCGEAESISHILFHCNFAKKMWKLVPWQNTVDTNETSTFSRMIQEAIRWRNLPPFDTSGNAFPWFCWVIWTSRNLAIFEKRYLTPIETATKAILAQKRMGKSSINYTLSDLSDPADEASSPNLLLKRSHCILQHICSLAIGSDGGMDGVDPHRPTWPGNLQSHSLSTQCNIRLHG